MNIDSLQIGYKEICIKKFTYEDVVGFSQISGDINPIHLDEKYAKNTIFKERIVHGLLVASLISNVIGNKLPGIGTVYLSQDLKFIKPVMINDTVTAEVKVLKINKDKRIVELSTRCYKDNNIDVILGNAKILIPNN